MTEKEAKEQLQGLLAWMGECGKCGRVFDHGYMVDDGGTTIREEE